MRKTRSKLVALSALAVALALVTTPGASLAYSGPLWACNYYCLATAYRSCDTRYSHCTGSNPDVDNCWGYATCLALAEERCCFGPF